MSFGEGPLSATEKFSKAAIKIYGGRGVLNTLDFHRFVLISPNSNPAHVKRGGVVNVAVIKGWNRLCECLSTK